MAAISEGGAIVRQGRLRKLKTMKKKYFVLRAETADSSARLEYYESEKKFRSGAAPRRVLPLKSCYNITRRLDLKQKHVIALFTREEQLCIVAENEQDLHAWLAAILKLFRNDDASEELQHPIQHVWQVNVQKKGLGASKNIQGLYNLCLTDKTLTLVKIKSQNNIISDLGIPERVEYSLKNIRRCGDSECFFYMEVGRQTATGAGELWMHSDDSNIAQSMHSTIYHAMRNCARETENEKDHIVIPGKTSLLLESSNPLPARRQTYSDGRGRAGLYNEAGLCVGACIRQCVCATRCSDDAPLADAENQPPNGAGERGARLVKHHRTVSLPVGGAWPELSVVHERTRSAPLTGAELDRALRDKAAARRAKLSPARAASRAASPRAANAGALRNRCETMPSRACSSFDCDRVPPRHSDVVDGIASSRDDIDSSEWCRTPRIPEEPDCCDILSRDFIMRGSSVAHSRTSSLGVEEGGAGEDGYLPMAPAQPSPSPSVCSGTPSTDPRFSEYQLEPATSHITEERSTRAYSVGSRPAREPCEPARLRAYSAGARRRPAPHSSHAPHPPHPPRCSTDDLMEIDFSANSPQPKVIVARTPPSAGFAEMKSKSNLDEYVDMSPRNAGYVEMRPGEPPSPAPAAPPEGYVEMSYRNPRVPTRPIAIANPRQPPPVASSPDTRRTREPRTPHGSQTIFPFSPDSPASPPELDDGHALSTVREISEEGRKSPERERLEVSSSPQYVTLARPDNLNNNKTARIDEHRESTSSCSAASGEGGPEGGRLHYAALDLEPRTPPAAPPHRLYTQIDWSRSEKYAADAL